MTEILVFLSPYLFIAARKRSLGQGNIFTPVCSHGGAWWRPPPDGYCYGRYASYWNAFLFFLNLDLIFNTNMQKKKDTWNVNFQKPIYGYTNVHSSARSLLGRRGHFLMENMGRDMFSNKTNLTTLPRCKLFYS